MAHQQSQNHHSCTRASIGQFSTVNISIHELLESGGERMWVQHTEHIGCPNIGQVGRTATDVCQMSENVRYSKYEPVFSFKENRE